MLGLDIVIWVVLAAYFTGMLLLGWWSRRKAETQEGYLVGNREFGTGMMVMHAFGAGTNPGDAAGVVAKTVAGGASGVWVSWMWMFGTPFYWLIAPVIRRMRCLTMADFFEQRFGRAASALYILVATVGMVFCLASVMLATTRTVQGMMGKTSGSDADVWFFGILLVTTATFALYGYWGGIVAAIRTDMIQGLMIIALSVIAIPAALRLPEVGGLSGMRATLRAAGEGGTNYLSLFDPSAFDAPTVLLLCLNAPLTALALPHLVSVCGAGRTEWEGRVGFTGGNMLKRVCTIGWSLLALCWLAYLLKTGSQIHPDAAFGDSIRHLLPPLLQGLMLACVLAAAMSSGDAFQVTVAGLISRNLYRRYVRKDADDAHLVLVTKVVGLVIVLASLLAAVFMRHSVVETIVFYFRVLALAGISVALGILWRPLNQAGVFCSVLTATAAMILTRYQWDCSGPVKAGTPILAGVVAGVVGSLVTRRPDVGMLEAFYRKIHVPVGNEADLELSLDEAVPVQRRWCTAGGLFIVKPSRESWVGFLVTLAACLVCVGVMAGLLAQ